MVRSPTGRVERRLVASLDGVTAGRRRRYAEDSFWGRPPRFTDALVSRAFFAISAMDWRRRELDPNHSAPFDAGIVTCRPPDRALDVGTGAGASAATIASLYPQASVYGVDGSRRMVRVAMAKHHADNLDFRQAAFSRLPWPDGEFDLITALNALPEPRELARVAALRGELLLANTYFGPLDGRWLERLAEFGFCRVAFEEVGAGCWQRFERR